MKAARSTAFGVPQEVVECAGVADVGVPMHVARPSIPAAKKEQAP